MSRLFAGTPFDVPPRCDVCGELESDCRCPPPPPQWMEPARQTARVRVEKRKAGRTVTVVAGLKAHQTDLTALLKRLKDHCGAGGSLREEQIELQGDQHVRVAEFLRESGYRVR